MQGFRKNWGSATELRYICKTHFSYLFLQIYILIYIDIFTTKHSYMEKIIRSERLQNSRFNWLVFYILIGMKYFRNFFKFYLPNGLGRVQKYLKWNQHPRKHIYSSPNRKSGVFLLMDIKIFIFIPGIPILAAILDCENAKPDTASHPGKISS